MKQRRSEIELEADDLQALQRGKLITISVNGAEVVIHGPIGATGQNAKQCGVCGRFYHSYSGRATHARTLHPKEWKQKLHLRVWKGGSA